MTNEDIANCTRPVLFENNMLNYEYSMLGSCFGIKYKNNYFILTARHVINNFNESNIRIIYKEHSQEFLPLLDGIVIDPKDWVEDTGKFDIAIYQIDKSKLNNEFDETTFYEIHQCNTLDTSFDFAIIIGYPQKNNFIDYEAGKISIKKNFLEAQAINESNQEFCFSFEPILNNLNNLNGFSGSPVVGNKKNGELCLLGMMIQNKHFLSINWIIDILDDPSISKEIV